jgi:hypothetical protein
VNNSISKGSVVAHKPMIRPLKRKRKYIMTKFFGDDFEMNLVYIYDAISPERPKPEALAPSNLIIGPSVVNNLGWVRGYWEIMASQPLGSGRYTGRTLVRQIPRYGVAGRL